MSAPLHLTITTPAKLVVEVDDVRSLRAADASGGFGIEPGHADFLTVLPASVVQWRRDGGDWRYCAVRAGVLTVSGGSHVAVAAREAVLGDDLATLEATVRNTREEAAEANRRARVEQLRVHTHALRQVLRHLMPSKHPEGFPAAAEGRGA